jgi:hypothetical protein
MSLCQYKNLFGEPRTGIHSLRIPLIDVGFWDVFFTILLGLFISIFPILFFKTNIKNTIIISQIFVFLLGIGIHRLFCVRTRVDKLLFKE